MNAASPGMLTVDQGKHSLKWNGVEVPGLTNSQFNMIVALAQERRMAYRDIYAIWRPIGIHIPDGGIGMNTNVRSNIKRVRMLFREVDPSFNAIKNLSGYGYEWMSEISFVEGKCDCESWILPGYICGKRSCPRTHEAERGLKILESMVTISNGDIESLIAMYSDGGKPRWMKDRQERVVLLLRELLWRRKAGATVTSLPNTSSLPTAETPAGTESAISASPCPSSDSPPSPGTSAASDATKPSSN